MSLTLRLRDQIESLVAYKGQGETFYVQQQTVSAEAGTEFVNQDFVNTVKGPGKVFKTLADAVDACVSGRGDEVVLLPGWYSIAAAITLSKSDVTIRSLSSEKKRNTVLDITGGGIVGLTVSGSDCTVKDLTFATGHASDDCLKITGMSTSVLGCEFRAGGAAGDGVIVSNASADDLDAAYITIKGCTFGGLLNAIDIASTGDTTGAIQYLTVEDCVFLGGAAGTNTYHIGMSGTWEGSHGLTKALFKDLTMEKLDTDFYMKITNGANCSGIITGVSFDGTNSDSVFSGVSGSGFGWSRNYPGDSVTTLADKPTS